MIQQKPLVTFRPVVTERRAIRLIRFRRLACAARLYVADDFLDDADIAHALAVAAREQAAPTRPGKHDSTGFSYEMPVDGDARLMAIRSRIAIALGYPNALGQTLRYRHYRPGESHPPHLDTYRIGEADLVATAMMCLSTPESGGETSFPDARPGLALRPVRGRLSIWLNCLQDGRPDPAARHAGAPVLGGDKITLTAFVYARPPGTPAFADGLVAEHAVAGVVRLAADG